jgi:uncharacterized protein (DUF1501 family)
MSHSHDHKECHSHVHAPKSPLNRRSFLKASTAGAVAIMGSSFGMPNIVFGAPGSKKTLIKIFQRGGADGLNLFPPYKDTNYYRLRPTIAISGPDSSNVNAAIDLDGTYGMNPNLADLKEIWDAGRLAISPGTHFNEGDRSHFDCQRWIETGTTMAGAQGIFGRYLEQIPGDDQLRAVRAGSSNLAMSLTSTAVTVPAITDGPGYKLENWQWCAGSGCSDNQLTQRLLRLGEAPPIGNDAEKLTRSVEKALVGSIATIQGASVGYKPDAGGMKYNDGLDKRPNTSMGRGLALVAQLLKKGVPVEVAAIDWEGTWDTHQDLFGPTGVADQSADNARTLKRGANDLLTFWRDLGPLRENVVVMIGTEFGREAYENGTKGADHGVGGSWIAFGGPTKGGIYGALPALSDANLKEGRFVPMVINYKNMMAEVMVRHLGVSQSLLPTLFPGWATSDFTDYKMFTRNVV